MEHNNGHDLLDPEQNGKFIEYRRLILFELRRLNTAVVELDRTQRKIFGEILVLKVKAGIWGLIGSAIPIVLTLSIYTIYQILKI